MSQLSFMINIYMYTLCVVINKVAKDSIEIKNMVLNIYMFCVHIYCIYDSSILVD